MLPNLIPGFGAIAGGVLSGINVRAQNRYNDPSRALARIRRAGLPMAAFSEQAAGNQSAVPEETLSKASEHLGSFLETTRQRKEIDTLTEALRGIKADSDLKEEDARIGLEQWYDKDEFQFVTNRKQAFKRDQRLKDGQIFLQSKQAEVTDLNRQALQELKDNGQLTAETRGKIALLGQQAGLISAQKNQIQNANKALNDIIRRMEKNGMSLGESLLLMFLQKGSGGASAGGFNIVF